MSATKYLAFAIFLASFTACVKKDVKLPEGYLTEPEMVSLLVDMHLVEGSRSGTLVLGDTNSLPDYYAKIYEKHGLKPIEFKESFFWYSKHPEAMKKVYEKVIVELSKKEEEVATEEKSKSVPKTEE